MYTKMFAVGALALAASACAYGQSGYVSSQPVWNGPSPYPDSSYRVPLDSGYPVGPPLQTRGGGHGQVRQCKGPHTRWWNPANISEAVPYDLVVQMTTELEMQGVFCKEDAPKKGSYVADNGKTYNFIVIP